MQGGEAAEVLQKLLRNVLAAPDEAKYRRLRLSNRRIQQAVVDVSGGVELLQERVTACKDALATAVSAPHLSTKQAFLWF